MSWSPKQFTPVAHRAVQVAPPVVEPRVKEALAAERASKASATVRVETLSPSTAASRYTAGWNWSDVNIELMVAPVMADFEAKFSGLVLSGQRIVVMRRTREMSSRFSMWGADATFKEMVPEDWSFVSAIGRLVETPVPATVTSHVRSLAYYDSLSRPQTKVGLDLFRRWGEAIAAVNDGVETIQALYGKPPVKTLVDTSDVDLTLEDVLATRNRMHILSWAIQARTVANAAKKARAKALDEWMEAADTQTPDVLSVSNRMLSPIQWIP